MQYLTKGSVQPRQGHFREDGQGGLVVVDSESGVAFAGLSVALVVVDDAAMGDKARAAGYQVHTPLSANLGLGSTEQ